tara:strand:+ start:123 stop:788 length:666 start_codon:yes stop_codon:yes gene_type:complete
MEKPKIQWSGKIDPDSEGAADNNEVPESVDIVWGGYRPCWADEKGNFSQERADECVIADMYFEDFDIHHADITHPSNIGDGVLGVDDVVAWINTDRYDIATWLLTSDDLCDETNLICIYESVQAGETTYLAPKNTYTWGDVAFVLEIFDGIGTYDRKNRLEQLLKDRKKKAKLIQLICRVKGEKVYDETKSTNDVGVKLEDVDLVINKVLGKIRVENIDVI